MGKKGNNSFASGIFILSLVVFAVLGSKSIREQIQDSNKRMADPDYRETLAKLGLLKKTL